MKTAMLPLGLAAGLALLPTTASAEVAHETSVVHNGQTVALSYEPMIETKLRQIGLGPRSSPACVWTSKISVQRSAAAGGQPIAALSRVIPGEKTRSGQRAGHCNNLSERDKTRLAGGTEALRAHVASAAGNDAPGLRTELASLSSLGIGDSHAR